MPVTYPFYVPSGVNLIAETNGFSNIGSPTNSFGDMYTLRVTPTAPGLSNLGSAALPFSGVYSNQYVTSRISGNITTVSYTLDWNLGSSQAIGFVNGYITGVSITLAGGAAGSSYVLETYNNASGTAKIDWGSNVKWQFGVSGIPTPSGNAIDLYTFYYNGSAYLGGAAYNYL